MTATVTCVWRDGGEFNAEHVLRLRDQVATHSPDLRFVCIASQQIEGVETFPLRHDWPGWWSKMELYRPDIGGDLMFLDLDVAVVGDIGVMASVGELTIMQDAYRPHGLQSAVMYLPERERAVAWENWMQAPRRWMSKYRAGGDQAFLERLWQGAALRWQAVLPGCLASYKADLCIGTEPNRPRDAFELPEALKLVVFHGRPRPWAVGW